MDMMSNFDNLDTMVGSDNINPIEGELVVQLRNHLFKTTLSLIYIQGKIFFRERIQKRKLFKQHSQA